MSELERIRLLLLRKILRREKAGVVVAGYFNGPCPVCDQHIGTDVFKDKLTGDYYAFCGACDREVYDHVDHTKILWLKGFKPV